MSSAPASPTGRTSLPPEDPTAEVPNGRWRLRNWRLRTKLLTVLLIPSLAALVLGAFQVRSDYQSLNTLDRNTTAVELGNDSAAVVQELQRERDLTVDFVAANRSLPRQQVDQQRARTDSAIQAFRGQIDQARSGPHPEIAAQFGEAAEHLDRLQSLRTVTDRSGYPPDAVLSTYSDSIGSLLGMDEQNVTAINNQQLARLSLAANSVSRAQEQESIKRAVLARALRTGSFPQGGERELLAAGAERDAALNDFRKWATPDQSQLYSDTVAGTGVDDARSIEETALVRGDSGAGLGGLDPNRWVGSSSESVDLTHQVGNQVRAQLLDAVGKSAERARIQMYIAAALVIGALVLAFAIALLVARSLLLPLRTLRRSALDIADDRLPKAVDSILHEPGSAARVQPIPVHTKEEIGRVARSFDEVNSQALRLASEQALLRNNINELFVNLARRSQTLVQRQLSLIDRLEQDEQDPDQLGSLFELDHLATRMRRNSENLLILGGTDLTRRMMRPVSLSEVIGAAVSEVEQYARISIADSPELAVQGRVVNDFVHLVAELLENATAFSNPDTEVSVRTAYRRQTLILEIRDHGVGVAAEELDQINERLARPPEIDASISRRMGLYVVAQLARRHDIRVELQNNQDLGGGVCATVHLSGEYVVQLTADGPRPMPDIDTSGDDGRDPVGDSGTHVGLAAAFGHSGGGASQRGVTAEPPTERVALNGSGLSDSAAGDPARVAEGATDHSVPISSAESFGMPAPERSWTREPDESATTGHSAQESAGQTEEPAPSGGTATWEHGVLSALTGSVPMAEPVFEEPEGEAPDLFHSPYEDEKTSEFRSTGGGWLDSASGGRLSPPEHPLGQPPPDRQEDDAPTERLPIYEAVLSQWFRETDGDESVERPGMGAALGSDFLSGSDRTDSTVREGAGAQSEKAESEKAEQADQPEEGTGQSEKAGRSEKTAQPERSEPDRSPLTRLPAEHSERRSGQLPTGPDDPGWGSADHGWQAAEALVEHVQQVEETTGAGLPKRKPKTNLVPGSVESSAQRSPTTKKPGVPRSADAVRGRMSSYQSGIRRGRHAKADPVSTEQSRSNPSRPEEQE